MKRWLPFVVPFVVVAAIGGGASWWMMRGGTPPCSSHTPSDLRDVGLDSGCVSVEGMAHYPVVVRQSVPGNLVIEERTWFLFPLFSSHDTANREIRVLMRTTREPERLVSYEFMKVEGRVVEATLDKVPMDTEVRIGQRSDYFFADDMVLLEPSRIEVDGEVWVPTP